MKGLMRKRSTTAARLQRAFSAKSLRTNDNQQQQQQHNNNKETTCNNNTTSTATNTSNGSSRLPSNRTKEGRPKRQFIMETPVQFTTVSLFYFLLYTPLYWAQNLYIFIPHYDNFYQKIL